MTAFAPSQIPAWVNSVERLAAWSATILAELNPTNTLVTAPGVAELSAQANSFRFANETVKPYRYAVVLYLPLPIAHRAGAPMRAIEEISALPIPTAFTQP